MLYPLSYGGLATKPTAANVAQFHTSPDAHCPVPVTRCAIQARRRR